MKKFVAISIMAALLLGAVAAVAMADANNWVLTLKATDATGSNYSGTLKIGWKAGYTNGIDSSLGEISNPVAPGPGGKAATIVSYLDANTTSLIDYRASEATDPATKYYYISTYTMGAWTDSTVKVTITPSTTSTYTYKMPLVIKYNDATAGWITKTYTASSPLASTGISFNVAAKTAPGGIANPDIIVMTPEPSSMVAMLSGLAGLAGFAIRRRRA